MKKRAKPAQTTTGLRPVVSDLNRWAKFMRSWLLTLSFLALAGCASPPPFDYFARHYGDYRSADGRTVLILSRSEGYVFLKKDGQQVLTGTHALRLDGVILIFFDAEKAEYRWTRISDHEQQLELIHAEGTVRDWPTLLTKK